jgi:acyl transferase domain-containing protein
LCIVGVCYAWFFVETSFQATNYDVEEFKAYIKNNHGDLRDNEAALAKKIAVQISDKIEKLRQSNLQIKKEKEIYQDLERSEKKRKEAIRNAKIFLENPNVIRDVSELESKIEQLMEEIKVVTEEIRHSQRGLVSAKKEKRKKIEKIVQEKKLLHQQKSQILSFYRQSKKHISRLAKLEKKEAALLAQEKHQEGIRNLAKLNQRIGLIRAETDRLEELVRTLDKEFGFITTLEIEKKESKQQSRYIAFSVICVVSFFLCLFVIGS